ncbi:bifunctional diguanylate cyclase/phosphodiesterase [Marinobacterium sp. YM272]|uniref:bifunctional diguanylate cyclase/phosphodiesterase n=1 Tax=Marinobacterium sp. YM272 TaxID=3421654 RepID=UPI003D7F4BB7
MEDRLNWQAHKRFALFACVTAALLIVPALYLPPFSIFAQRPEDYLSVHLLLELCSVIVSVMVISIAWKSLAPSLQNNANLLIVGFTVIACSDMLHALVYDGMPSLLVDGSTSTAIFFWLAGRFTEVIMLLLFACRIRLGGSPQSWFVLGVAAFAVLWAVGISGGSFIPVLFVPGEGVTPFKEFCEYLISASNLMLAAWLYWQAAREKHAQTLWFATSCFIMGVGELAFVHYLDPSEFALVVGHLYKVAAYLFIYRATFYSAVNEPYFRLQDSERRIRTQDRELRTLLSSLPLDIARFDPDLRLRYMSPGFSMNLLAQPVLPPGHHLDQVVAAEVAGQLQGPLRDALKGQRSECDVEYERESGSSRFSKVVVLPEWLAGGGRGVLTIFADTTEQERSRRRMEQSLQENNEIRMALDAHAIVAFTDAEGVITSVNDRFCLISKYPRDELIGRTHSVINSGVHPPEFFKELWQVISRGDIWNGEICNRAKDGSLYWVHTTIVPLSGPNGLPERYIAIRADVTKRKQAEAEAQHLALHDALTGLPNRRLMKERLIQSIQTEARAGSHGAVLLLDLDNFKEVNDTFGHNQGDELLYQVAQRLADTVREGDTVTRLGGDEFVVLLSGVGQTREQAMTNVSVAGGKIESALARSFKLANSQVNITPSIGAVLFNRADDDYEELIKQADIALYKAKAAGRNRLCFFDPSLQEEAVRRSLLIRELRYAQERDELCLFYQPIVGEERQVIAMEALIRWKHSTKGLISPGEFIPLAEQSGLILPIGLWVLNTACRQLAEWSQNPQRAHWALAVNVSARQLNQEDFVDQVAAALSNSGAPADRLRLEITESMLQDNLEATVQKMTLIRELGVHFSLDDFGTGYSSLSYLKRLPLDVLKIDKSFVDGVLDDPNDTAIVSTILALAQTLELRVVAEGVETVEQMDLLVEKGCRFFQGYLFGKPAEISHFDERSNIR